MTHRSGRVVETSEVLKLSGCYSRRDRYSISLDWVTDGVAGRRRDGECRGPSCPPRHFRRRRMIGKSVDHVPWSDSDGSRWRDLKSGMDGQGGGETRLHPSVSDLTGRYVDIACRWSRRRGSSNCCAAGCGEIAVNAGALAATSSSIRVDLALNSATPRADALIIAVQIRGAACCARRAVDVHAAIAGRWAAAIGLHERDVVAADDWSELVL